MAFANSFNEQIEEEGYQTGTSRKEGYLYRDGELQYSHYPRAEIKTLVNVNLEQLTCINYDYAHDGATVWFKGVPIAEADPATFTLVPGKYKNYYKDKSNVYFNGTLIPNADLVTFTNVEGAWSRYFKDAQRVYLNGEELEWLSLSAFAEQMENWAIVQLYVYDGYILEPGNSKYPL